MIHAVNASVLSEIPVRRDKTDKANSENMITERTTEGERPVKKANPHNAVIITTARKSLTPKVFPDAATPRERRSISVCKALSAGKKMTVPD